MKKFFVIVVLLLSISFAVNAASLCGGGLRFEFTGNDRGTVVLYLPNGDTLKGTYLSDHRNDIRIVWGTSSTVDKLVFVNDGVFKYGNITLKECK